MNIIAINGSPRKNWNTHILLEKCLAGAKEKGAETELINLYDIDFKGCTSCFACKRKGNILDKCAMTFFDGIERLKRRETVFVEDCKKAFSLGEKLCTK